MNEVVKVSIKAAKVIGIAMLAKGVLKATYAVGKLAGAIDFAMFAAKELDKKEQSEKEEA